MERDWFFLTKLYFLNMSNIQYIEHWTFLIDYIHVYIYVLTGFYFIDNNYQKLKKKIKKIKQIHFASYNFPSSTLWNFTSLRS